MSTSPDAPRQSDSRTASIAWAVAAIVIALVVAFIAWLAMGDGAEPTAEAPATSAQDSATQDGAAPTGEGTAEDGTGTDSATDSTPDAATSDSTGSDSAAQSPPPEVEQFMLGLQRRDADDAMAVGDVDAPVVMIEYADYRCPYCARHHRETRPELTPLVEDGTLRIEFRDLVIFDETSLMAALGGRGAAAQGLLEEYQAEVFALSEEGHGEYTQEDLVEIAEQIGVEDLEAFEAAFDDPEILAAVQADTQEARSIGITSTPSFLINTQVVQGAYPLPYFEEVIEAERAKAETAPTTR